MYLYHTYNWNTYIYIHIYIRMIRNASIYNSTVPCSSSTQGLIGSLLASITQNRVFKTMNPVKYMHGIVVFYLGWFQTAIPMIYSHIDGLAQDCSNSIAIALELLQFCAKPSRFNNAWWYLRNSKDMIEVIRDCTSWASRIFEDRWWDMFIGLYNGAITAISVS